MSRIRQLEGDVRIDWAGMPRSETGAHAFSSSSNNREPENPRAPIASQFRFVERKDEHCVHLIDTSPPSGDSNQKTGYGREGHSSYPVTKPGYYRIDHVVEAGFYSTIAVGIP